MMITSDAFISSFGKCSKAKKKSFHLEAVTMFLCTNDSVVDDNDDDEMDVE